MWVICRSVCGSSVGLCVWVICRFVCWSSVGLCVPSPAGTAHCQCSPGWTGDICQLLDNPCLYGPCPNGTVCVDESTLDHPAVYHCTCPGGFTGELLADGIALHTLCFLHTVSDVYAIFVISSQISRLHDVYTVCVVLTDV